MQFICYPKCTTCKKAENWLKSSGMKVEMRNIKDNKPTLEELKKWHSMSGLPLKRFFNTSGLVYKELKLSERLADMSEEEQFSLLASDGMLVKRPILASDSFVLVGFKENEWETALKTKTGSKYELLWKYISNSRQDRLKLSFEDIEKVAGVPTDHSFLNYKKELTEYGYKVGKISMKENTVIFERVTVE